MHIVIQFGHIFLNILTYPGIFDQFLGGVKRGVSMHKPGKTVPGPWSRLKAPQKDQFHEY